VTCERCGQAPGAITYTEYGEDGARKLRICAACARELGFDVEPAAESPATAGAPEIAKVVGILGIEAVLGAAGSRPEPDDPRECPGCGMTGNELRQESLFGCPACYDAFRDSLDPLFRRIHGAVMHRGRVPGGRAADPVDVDRLRRDLCDAIAQEDFERAARLRDRLRRAGAPGADDPEGPS